VNDVSFGTGVEIIDTNHITAFFQQTFTQKRTQKSGASGYQHAFLEMHGHFLLTVEVPSIIKIRQFQPFLIPSRMVNLYHDIVKMINNLSKCL
jgi:hypothetical protein